MLHIGRAGSKASVRVTMLAVQLPEQRFVMIANELLTESTKLLYDRGLQYGDPTANHIRIAQLWSAYLNRGIEPHEVAICMALVKVSRLSEQATHKDSYADAISYMAIAGHIALTDFDNDLDAY
jgi:hypothetical protein